MKARFTVGMRGFLRSCAAGALLSALMGVPGLQHPIFAETMGATPRATETACANAGVTSNAVVRFYLALDRHQYTAAYGCLSPATQATMPFSTFVAGYGTSRGSRLLMVGDGSTASQFNRVRMILRGFDQTSAGLTMQDFGGTWDVTPDGHLDNAHIRAVSDAMPASEVALPSFDDTANRTNLVVLWRSHMASGPNGAPADVIDVSGKGCGSCHGQELYIFQGSRLIFSEDNSDIAWARYAHGTLTIRAGRDIDGYRTEHWVLTPVGFATEDPCSELRSSDVASNEFNVGSDTFPGPTHRTFIARMRTKADLVENSILSGMASVYPAFGYVAGCSEQWKLPGSGSPYVQVQTDVFRNRRGGLSAYQWDQGLSFTGVMSWRNIGIDRSSSEVQAAEAISYVDTTNKDRSLRGTWLVGHMRQDEVVLTFALYTSATDVDAARRLRAILAYAQDALFEQLGTVSAEWSAP